MPTILTDSCEMNSQTQNQCEELHNWEKVLWKRQAYPDNFVPPKLFLASLQRNREII
jgi:hypothetical protein